MAKKGSRKVKNRNLDQYVRSKVSELKPLDLFALSERENDRLYVVSNPKTGPAIQKTLEGKWIVLCGSVCHALELKDDQDVWIFKNSNLDDLPF